MATLPIPKYRVISLGTDARMADDEVMAFAAAVDASSASDAETQMEDEVDRVNGVQDDAADAWDASENQASSETDGADAGDALDGKNPLVKGLVPTTKTFDRHVQSLVRYPLHNLYFNQWKLKLNQKTTVKRLRLAFEELLPRLMGARDYAGAAKVLGTMYHRFTVTPALCIEASLEILRRQPDYRNDLLNFYEAALNIERIDKMLILKEMWLFHVAHGEFYEAYHLYQDKIGQMEEIEDDARLLANFGILCYWLMFIESKELRDTLKREDIEYEEEEDDNLDATVNNGYESIESMIESNYMFKTPIGVHILYQQASNALRRAVALSPTSAMFVEYYVQLLVLVGDIQSACDYLEAYYHTNPDDPHGPRMFARFLGCYYPDSVDAQVAAFSRWMKNDPSSRFPLEKMLELSSAGAVSSFVLTKVLVEALDTCGSDVYIAQDPDIALVLWRNLAELLAAMDEDEFLLDQVERGKTNPSNQVTIADVGTQRLWWKRVYFASPSTAQEVVAVAKRDSTFMEVSIYRAAVANRLFPDHLPMVAALRFAMASPDVTFHHEHVRLFKSFFPSASDTIAEVKVQTLPFSAMHFIHVTVDAHSKRQNAPLPIFKGSSDTLHVIDRKSIVEREATSEKTEVVVTRTGKTEDADPQFVEELCEALEYEDGYSITNGKRSHRKRKADAISTSSTPVLLPAFVGMVEEEVYNNPDAAVRHIYSMIHQKLRRSDMLVPTSKVVAYCVDFFRNRLKQSLKNYGHRGLLMRYEEFIVTYLRRQRAKGVHGVTMGTAKAAIEEMKRVLPSPHPHFPDENLVEETMRTKTTMIVRQRRLQLIDLKKALKPVLRKLVYVEDRTFVDAVYSVYKQNGLLGVVARTDVARTVQNILPMHYYRVLQKMPSRSLQLLTSPEFRKGYNTPENIMKELKKRKSQRTIEEVKALLWVERYEALYGAIIDEESDSDSDSDSSSNSDSCSDISSDSDRSSSSDMDEENKGGEGIA